MKFFKLERKEFKAYSKRFRNTFIGGRLYLIFDFMCSFLVVGILEILFIEFGLFNDNSVTNIELTPVLICTLISYYVYFKYLKEYIENSKKESNEEDKEEN